MPPPSNLMIATSALNRLVKEEISYHKEYEHQKGRIAKLEQGDADENAEYTLRQERKALEETEAMFPRLKQNIQDALQKLETQLNGRDPTDQSTPEDIAKAKEAIAAGTAAIHKTS